MHITNQAGGTVWCDYAYAYVPMLNQGGLCLCAYVTMINQGGSRHGLLSGEALLECFGANQVRSTGRCGLYLLALFGTNVIASLNCLHYVAGMLLLLL